MKNKCVSPGDYVEIIFIKKSYKGILLKGLEKEKKIIFIKLDSGYNIGFNKKEILEIKLLKKFSSKQEKKQFFKKDTEKPNIAMIITGGTIASRLDLKTGGVNPLSNPDDLFSLYPKIFQKINISKIEIPFLKTSEDMDFNDWKKIARTTKKFLDDSNIKGVVITHGTDFLHYTSSALSFFLKNLNKPVVLTYSQRSIDRASSDASLNLQCSVLMAISDIAEVSIVGHATDNDDYCYAIRGTKSRKLHSSKRNSFKSINSKPIAKVYPDSIEIISDYNPRKNGKVVLDAKFQEKIALLKIYPGQDPEILDYYLEKNYKGIILEMSGLGHVPLFGSKKNWIKKLKQIISKGIIVCGTTQCINGRVNPYVYSNGRELLDAGVIFLQDMLSETAFVKLGYVLSKTNDAGQVKKLMLENLAGELSERLF